MNRQTLRSLTAVVLLGLIATGCGDDDSPTAPDPDPQVIEHILFRAEIQRFEALVDGDGVEGAGDFEFVVRVGYRNERWEATLSSGESKTLNRVVEWGTTYSGEPHDVEIYFSCVEWDQNIFGEVYADSDMNWRSATAVESIDGGDVIGNVITLGNSNCRVRLHYRLTAEIVETVVE